MYANRNKLAIFLSLNRITVDERVILWNVIFYCCNMYVLEFLYSMMSSGDSFKFPASDISLLVRDCNVIDSIYYPNYVSCIGTLSAHYQLLKWLKCSQTWKKWHTAVCTWPLSNVCNASLWVILYNGQWFMEYRDMFVFFLMYYVFERFFSHIPAIWLAMKVLSVSNLFKHHVKWQGCTQKDVHQCCFWRENLRKLLLYARL